MVTRRSVQALGAAALLGIACAFDTPLRLPIALPLVVLALAVSAASLTARGAQDRNGVPGSVWMLVAAMSALGLVDPGTSGPTWYEVVRRGFAAFGVVAVGLAAGEDPAWRRRGVLGAMFGSSILALLTPAATPHPQIDVVPWTDAAVRAFISGVHPYTVLAPDVYQGGRDFGFVVRVYPYMPATILAFAPFTLVLGDFRYALAACTPLTLWLLRRVGHSSAAAPQLVDAATLLLALHPAGAIIVRSGWTEPLLGLLSAWLALSLVRKQRLSAAIGALLMPAIKQYALAPVLLWAAAIGRRTRWTTWAVACGIAALTAVPFLIWNAPATMTGILFQMRAPAHPRLNSISIPGLLANASTLTLPIWISALAQLVVSAVLAFSGAAATTFGVLAGSAVALLVTFLLGWQAFVNYYAWIGTLLVLAAVTDRQATEPA